MEEIKVNKSVFQRYAEFKSENGLVNYKKSGHNKGLGFDYHELADFSAKCDELLLKHGLVYVGPVQTTDANGKDWVKAWIYTTDGMENIPFCWEFERSTHSNNPIQAEGGTITYWRRYMKALVCEMIENDEVDSNESKPKAKPKSGDGSDGMITDIQWTQLNALYTKEQIKAMYKELGITNGKQIPNEYAEKKINEQISKNTSQEAKPFY